MSNPLETASQKISLFSKWFAGLGLLIMTAIIAMQVFTRYVLNDSPPWAEQAAAAVRPYVRLDEARSQMRPGTGLGLAIAQNVCNRHGWRLSFERGADRFTVRVAW